MSKVYDIAFGMGIMFNVLLFVTLNAVSSIINQRAAESSGIEFAPAGYNWGFPFNWGEDYSMILEAGSILNFGALLLGCVFFGFLFKIIWSGISQSDGKLV